MPTILCIDDETALRRIITAELRDSGYDTIEAADGREGLEAIQTHRPDLILCDVGMPGMDGFELLRRYRQRRIDEVERPFIFLSALADRMEVIEGRRLGADDYLAKPVDMDLMLAMVSTRLAQARRVGARANELAETNRALAEELADRLRSERELRAAKERSDEAARLKSDFLAMMSHEIRTPLNGILGMLRFLLETRLDREQKDFAETALYSGEALLTILNDVLDYSKLEAGKLDIETVPFEPARLITSVVGLMASRTRDKGLALDHAVDVRVPKVVLGDPHRLRQILLNLIGNGIKFTERGSVSVALRLEDIEGDDARLEFSVADTGIGIAEADKAKLFEDYSQVDASISRRFGGTGLGLAISRKLVNLMGGEIGVDSAAGQGSRFWFRLPAPVGAGNRALRDDAAEPESDGSPPPLRILLAEDNLVNQKVAAGLLSRHGHTVDIVGDGKAAVAAVAAGSYDVVLMDMIMPGVDGLEAARRIRELGNHKGEVPIIALTGNALKGDDERCLAAGMDGYVSKPIDRARLFSELRRCTGARGGGGGSFDRDACGPEPVLDPRQLDELEAALGTGNVAALAGDLISASEALIEELADARHEGRLERLAAAGHDFKSMAGTFGLSALHRLAEAVELASREGRLTEAEALAKRIPDCYREARVRIRARYPEADAASGET